MAQQIISAAQLVLKFQGIRRYNNYVMLQIVYLQQFWKIVRKVPNTKDTIRFKIDDVDMFRTTIKLLVETLDNLFVAPVNIEKYPSISQRLDEDYHSIKDDIPLEYEKVLFRVEVPMNQPQLGKKRKQSAGETNSLRKSLKVTIRQKKQSTTPLPSDDIERDEIVEATLLSITLHKTALAAEAQENVAKVQEMLTEEEIEKMVEGKEDEESYASEFADSMFNEDDEFGTRIEPGSHKENPKVVDEDEVNDKVKQDEVKDDDVEKTDDVAEEKDNDDHTNHTLVRTHVMGMIQEVLDHCNNVVPEMTFSEKMRGSKKRCHVWVNLTASTLTFPGIEAHEPYSIVDKPTTGLIYLNNQDEKRVTYLMDIVKFCDATLEKVLKEVKLKIFQSEPWKNPPLLGELDRDIMKAFKREISKRLSHR
uniref:Uncharacterized protein n=1 Tax=Tanacetum cinerariifolium TaxID=118510 RepID=A0A6L2JLE3_TANCI|nr:hypothetical protein [Tanacetum cinerariifolium]